jgi:hypothetical protein
VRVQLPGCVTWEWIGIFHDSRPTKLTARLQAR